MKQKIKVTPITPEKKLSQSNGSRVHAFSSGVKAKKPPSGCGCGCGKKRYK